MCGQCRQRITTTSEAAKVLLYIFYNFSEPGELVLANQRSERVVRIEIYSAIFTRLYLPLFCMKLAEICNYVWL